MAKSIEKVVVLGAGTMGARIAAHIANAGVSCALLDIAPAELTAEEQKRGLTLASPDVRDRIVRTGLAAAVKARPAAFFMRGLDNRIGTFSMLNAIRLMGELGMTFEEVDACTGPALGWPRSATFRLADIVGIDVLLHVIHNIHENIPNDESRELYRVPTILEEMARRGWIGEKTGSGFYKRVKKSGGESEILTLDPVKMEYRPQQKARLASIEAGKAIENTRERLRMLTGPVLEGKEGDQAQKFIWGILSGMCLYA